jgi:hypothetical protein
MGGQVAYVGERSGAYKGLEVKAKGKRLLEIPRRCWENDIKWILKKSFERALNGLIWLRTGKCGVLLNLVHCRDYHLNISLYSFSPNLLY